jgi:hypothetical protein
MRTTIGTALALMITDASDALAQPIRRGRSPSLAYAYAAV